MTAPLPQLILLPGLLNDAALWRDQISDLADVARVWVPDLTPYATLREMADSVLTQAEPTFALAGFSMGGYVAQEIARIAPKRIERLALLDTSIRVDTPERAAQRRALNKAAAKGGTFLGIGQAIMKSYVDASRLDDADLTGRIVDMTQRLGREVFLRQNSLEREDGEAALRALRVPLVIIVGENDQITPAPRPPRDGQGDRLLAPGGDPPRRPHDPDGSPWSGQRRLASLVGTPCGAAISSKSLVIPTVAKRTAETQGNQDASAPGSRIASARLPG